MGIEESGNPLNRAIAEELRDRKKQAKITFATLMTKTGMAERTIKRVINDERSMDTDQLTAVAEALGVQPADIVRAAMSRLEQNSGVAATPGR